MINDIRDKVSPAAEGIIKARLREVLNTGIPISPSSYEEMLNNKTFGEDIRKFYNCFFEVSDNGGTSNHFMPAIAAEYISNMFPYIIIDGIFYVYRSGVYVRDGKSALINSLITSLIRPSSRTKQRGVEVVTALRWNASKEKTFEQVNLQPDHWVNFRNGFYDPIEKKFYPHEGSDHQKYFSIGQIPHDFNIDDAPEGPVTEKFLQHLCQDENDREMILEYMGICMNTDTSLQKMLLLYGLPNCGKSRLLEMLEHISGKENTSGKSLQDICNDRFATYGILGKQVNICADLTKELIRDPAVIKLITGEDTVTVQRKGVDAFDTRLKARFVFSTNDLPQINARDGSFFRRVMILRIDHLPETVDPSLQKKLEAETDYMIHLCIKALERYYERPDRRTIESDNSKYWVEKWQSKSDSVSAFLQDERPFEEDGSIRRSKLYSLYEDYCSAEGRQSLGKSKFTAAMIDKGYQLRILHGWEVFTAKDGEANPIPFEDASETPFS